jgi:hypothetical protein
VGPHGGAINEHLGRGVAGAGIPFGRRETQTAAAPTTLWVRTLVVSLPMSTIGFTMPERAYGNLRHAAHRPLHERQIGTEDFEAMKFLIASHTVTKDHAVLFSQSRRKSALVLQNIPSELLIPKAEPAATACDVALTFANGS